MFRAVGERSEHHDRQRILGIDAPGGLDAVEDGHPEIEDRNVRLRRSGASSTACSPSAASATTIDPVLLEHSAQVHADDRLVLRDAARGSGYLPSSSIAPPSVQ